MGLLAGPDPWWAKFWTAQTPLLLDWGQTLNIAQHPGRFHELNPILGPHPSTGSVNTYFGLATLANLGMGALGPTPKKILRGGLTALELANVIRNRRIGISLSGPF
jgi:hypothetical protein